MTLDWDGRIRMDPSSPYAMRGLIELKDKFDDRVGVRHRSRPSRRSSRTCRACCRPITICRCASIICTGNRPDWPASAAVGKTVVSSSMIDRVTAGARAQAVRSTGGIQVVRRRAAEPDAGIRRRRERRLVVSGAGRIAMDDGQGRHHRGAAGGGNRGANRPRSRRNLRDTVPAARHAESMNASTRRPTRASGAFSPSCRPATSPKKNWRAKRLPRSSPRLRATAIRLAELR